MPLGCTAAAMHPCCPCKQMELSKNILQNLQNKLPHQTVVVFDQLFSTEITFMVNC